MKTRIIALSVCLIVLVVIGVYWYQKWNGPLINSTYKTGDEIKDFPVLGISLTFTDSVTSKTILTDGFQDIGGGVGNQVEYVIVSVTIRNLENTQIVSPKLDDYKFVLLDSAGNQLNSDPLFWDSSNRSPVWDMGILVPNAQDITYLAPHQALNGYLYFVIVQTNSPIELHCLQGWNTSPNFIVYFKP